MASLARIGIDNIKLGYDMFQASPYYALFSCSRDKPTGLLFSYTGDDRDQGWKLLQENLEVLNQTAPQVPHIIRFYADTGKRGTIEPSTPYTGSFELRMQEYAGRQLTTTNGQGFENPTFNSYLQIELQQAKEQIRELQEENRELEAEIDELQQEMDKKPDGDAKHLGVIGMIGDAGNRYPWMQDIIKSLTEPLKDAFTVAKARMRPQEQSAVINGVPDDAPTDKKVTAALQALVRCYVNLNNMPVSTNEEIEAANVRAFALLADDLAMLARAWQDPDVMELSLRKLKALA